MEKTKTFYKSGNPTYSTNWKNMIGAFLFGRFGFDRVQLLQYVQPQSETLSLSIADWPQQLFHVWISHHIKLPHPPATRESWVLQPYKIIKSDGLRWSQHISAPGAKVPPCPVESPSPPAPLPCSARNAPASSSRPAGRRGNPNEPRLARSTWSPGHAGGEILGPQIDKGMMCNAVECVEYQLQSDYINYLNYTYQLYHI